MESRAKQAIKANPGFTFTGSAQDYARSSMSFHAIVERRGIRGLMEVYQTMLDKNVDFTTALRIRFGWDRQKLNTEVHRLLKLQ